MQRLCKQAFIAFAENTKCLWFIFTNTLFELEKAQEKSPVFLSAWDKSVKIPGSFHLDYPVPLYGPPNQIFQPDHSLLWQPRSRDKLLDLI